MNAPAKKYREPVADGPCRACGQHTRACELVTYGTCENCWDARQAKAATFRREAGIEEVYLCDVDNGGTYDADDRCARSEARLVGRHSRTSRAAEVLHV